MSFGASTRTYTIREKPQSQSNTSSGDGKGGEDEELKGLLGLPEEETELEVCGCIYWVWVGGCKFTLSVMLTM